MGDQHRTEDTSSSGTGSDLGTRDATGSPSEGDRMDAGLHTARGRSEVTSPPAGLESDLEGVGIHGAEEGEQDRAEPGSDAQQMARSGAEKAFPESSDSEYLERG